MGDGTLHWSIWSQTLRDARHTIRIKTALWRLKQSKMQIPASTIPHKYNNLHQTLHFPSLVSTDQSDNAHLRLPPQQTAASIPHQTHPTTTFPPSHLPPQPPNPTTHTLSPHPPTILCLHPRNPPPRPPANHAPTIPSTRAATAAAAADPTARRIAACRLSGRLARCWGRAVWRWVRLGRMG